MTNRDKYILFAAVPKTGTGGIKQALDLSGQYHKSLSDYSKQLDISKYFKFTFFRNPWARVVSGFHFAREIAIRNFIRPENDNAQRSGNIEIYHKAIFSDYIKYVYSNEELLNKFNNHILFRPQLYWVDPFFDKLDFIGRFESYEEDKNFLVEKFGIKAIKLENKFHSSNKSKNWRYYYDDETAEIINRIYEKEIKLLKYKF